MKLSEIHNILSSLRAPEVLNKNIFNSEIQSSIQYLSSDAAKKSIEADPYWPKWDSPWWHMLLLHEMCETHQIPDCAIEKMIAALNSMPLKIFPIHPGELLNGVDPYRHTSCHCALGSVYQILASKVKNIDQQLPWIRTWFLGYQMSDGGLNCDSDAYLIKEECPSSMVGTIAVFEAVLLCTPRDYTVEENNFLNRCAQFLIQRKLMLGSTTKHNADEREDESDWLKLCFPRYYFYDVLRGLNALLAWAEKTNQVILLSAVSDVVSHLVKHFPDSILKNERTCYADTTTLLYTKGEWVRKQPTTFFPLLEKTSMIGDTSPYLTSRWMEARERIIQLIEQNLIVETSTNKTALKKYTKYYEDPIIIKKGDRVNWMEKDSEWTGWRWCIHPISKKEGWVPENCLKLEGSQAEVIRNYSAMELTAEADEQFLIMKEESGWYWCQNLNMEQGWLPKELFSHES